MVSKICKNLSVLFCVLFLFSCISHKTAVVVDEGDSDTNQEVSDVFEPFADEDRGEISDEDISDIDFTGEDSDTFEDSEPFSDEDVDTDFAEIDEDSEPFSDEDEDVDFAEADEDIEPFSDEDEDTDFAEVDEDVVDPEPYDGETLALRIVAGNVTSGNNQSYDPGHGIRILQALKPDIVLVQEMNYGNNTVSDYTSFAQKIVGTNYYAVDKATYQIPNGVVSKYPITKSGYWKDPNISNRALMWAVIDIPGEKDIFAISVHLHTSPASDQTTAALVIVNEIKKLKAEDPDKYYYVVGGDFNGPTSVSSSGFGKDNTFYVAGPDPVGEDGDEGTNANRNKQYDFVLADYPLHEFQVPTIFYSSKDSTKTKTYKNGLVFDTRLYSQSELNEYFSPAQTGDSSASQMQHMAIVKDFLIEIK